MPLGVGAVGRPKWVPRSGTAKSCAARGTAGAFDITDGSCLGAPRLPGQDLPGIIAGRQRGGGIRPTSDPRHLATPHRERLTASRVSARKIQVLLRYSHHAAERMVD